MSLDFSVLVPGMYVIIVEYFRRYFQCTHHRNHTNTPCLYYTVNHLNAQSYTLYLQTSAPAPHCLQIVLHSILEQPCARCDVIMIHLQQHFLLHENQAVVNKVHLKPHWIYVEEVRDDFRRMRVKLSHTIGNVFFADSAG